MTSLRPATKTYQCISRQCLRAFSTSKPCHQDPPSPRSSNAEAQGALLGVLSRVAKPGSQHIPTHNETLASLQARQSRGEGLTSLAQSMAKDTASYPTSTTSVAEGQMRRDLEMQLPRKWRAGDVYAPHDLSGAEARKWKKTNNRPTKDAFDVAGIDPLREYKNYAIMSEFMTEMGRIKPRSETGLRPVNQRRLAKAISRAVGIGIMPSVHRHPQLLEIAKNRQRRL